VDDDDVAICRIMTIEDLLKQKKEKAKVVKEHRKSLKQSVPKQIELNWAIGPNDLEHKMTQLKGFIEDGKKVEIVLARKKRQRQATPEEGMEVLKKVRARADSQEKRPGLNGGIYLLNSPIEATQQGHYTDSDALLLGPRFVLTLSMMSWPPSLERNFRPPICFHCTLNSVSQTAQHHQSIPQASIASRSP
jgi:hypothetical protein